MFTVILLVVIKKPAAAAGALLCTYGLEQWSQSQSAFFFTHQWLTNIVTAVVVCFAIVMRFIHGKPVINPVTPQFWLTFVLLAYASMSVFWSVYPTGTWDILSDQIKYFAAFTLLMPLVIGDLSDVKATLFTLVIIGFGISLWLLTMANWTDRSIMFQTSTVLSKGLDRGNPLAIATMGSQAALIAVLMNFDVRFKVWRILRYVVFAVGLAVAVKSGSRGQAAGLIIAILAFLPMSRRFRDARGFLGFAATVVIVGLVIVAVFDAYISDEGRTGTNNADRWSLANFLGAYEGGRLGTSMILLNAWAERGPIYWLLGLGSSASYDPTLIGIYPHLVALEVLGELGLIGFTILSMVPILAYISVAGMWRYVKDDPEDRGLLASMAGLLLFEIILSFKQGSLMGSHALFGEFIILGRLYANYRRRAAELEQIDAGGYAMTEADWQESDEVEGLLPELAPSR